MSMIPPWLRRVAYMGSSAPEKPRLTLGFIPLTDCAPLVIALEKGWFARYGLDVVLSKETSWANIRDKVVIGILDGAQMLAPMPIASTLGLGPVERPTITALSLDLNGNAITVSQTLYSEMRALDPAGMTRRPFGAEPLRRVIQERATRGEAPLTFAVVFPVSTHAYQLRYWMGAAGIDPDRDLRLIVVPPPQMVSQLKAGHIDGFCVPTSTSSSDSRRPSRGAPTPSGSSTRCCAGATSRVRSTSSPRPPGSTVPTSIATPRVPWGWPSPASTVSRKGSTVAVGP